MREGLYLFTGPDWYFLSKEIEKRQKNFTEKFWKENCLTFSTNNISLQAIQESLQGWWLFATKKLIIYKGVPDDKAASWDKRPAQITHFLESLLDREDSFLPPDTIIVFVSLDPDKRGKLYKLLLQKASVKDFPSLTNKQLYTFLKQELWEHYDESLADYLVWYVWGNLFRLKQEVDKIKHYLIYTNKKKLSESEQQSIVYTTVEANSFAVIDALIAWDIKKVLEGIDTLSASEVVRPEFIGTLYWWLKHILQTVDLYSRWVKSAKDIASEIGMHFFPIVKNLKYIDFLTANKNNLAKIYHNLLKLDASIKSWAFPAEGFWSEIKNIIYKELQPTEGNL